MSDAAVNSEREDLHRHGAVGTWRLKVTFPKFNVKTKTIIAFTSDGIVHQTAARFPESALGVWEPHGENEFKVTFFILQHDSEGREIVARVRADFTLLDHDTLAADATVDILDASETITLFTEPATVTGTRLVVTSRT